jgi:hypothetical protein
MSFEYIIANIKIPIQLFENGVTSAITERIHVEIEKCDELPEIQDNYNKAFVEKLSSFLHKLPTPHLKNENENENKSVIAKPTITESTNREPIFPPPPRIFITKDEIKSYSKKQSSAVSFKNNRHKKAKRMTLKNYYVPSTIKSVVDSSPLPTEKEL